MSEISKEEFAEWKNDSVTKHIMGRLFEMKVEYLENMGNNHYDEDMSKMVMGRVQAYNDLLNIDWED